jgi:hypothetical protein
MRFKTIGLSFIYILAEARFERASSGHEPDEFPLLHSTFKKFVLTKQSYKITGILNVYIFDNFRLLSIIAKSRQQKKGWRLRKVYGNQVYIFNQPHVIINYKILHVFQLQVPLQLPCYDFIPIKAPPT